MDHQEEYKSVFLAEAEGHLEETNRLLTQLEREPTQSQHVHALFRITHTLKGNAESMGFEAVAEVAHVLEDLFGVVRDQNMVLSETHFSSLFRASDVLGKLLVALKTGEKVSHRGIKTKLKVLTKNLLKNAAPVTEAEPDPAADPMPQAPESALALPPESELTEPVEPTEETETEAPVVSWSAKDLVKVPVHKLDDLLNLVGELVIERDRILATHGPIAGPNEFSRLNRLASDLQYAVMDVRLVQVGFLFNKYHRTLRDAAVLQHKKVQLVLEGTDTEIDRNVLQALSDSLTHLIRNAVAHGIEAPEVRTKLGKPEEGTIILSARSDNDAVVLEIRDDGAGIAIDKVRNRAQERGLISAEHARILKDEDLLMYIFEPGFSTQETVSTLSGRGVGMDVVKRAVESVGGTIRIHTEANEGTTILLRVPASMAVKGTLLCELQGISYAIPLIYTDAVVSAYVADMHPVAGRLVFTYLGEPIPILFLKDLFALQHGRSALDRRAFYSSYEGAHPEQKLELVLVESHGRKVALVVDKLLQQKEIVEKPLGAPLAGTPYLSGVTILGSGHVCPVLNVVSITNTFFLTTMSEPT